MTQSERIRAFVESLRRALPTSELDALEPRIKELLEIADELEG